MQATDVHALDSELKALAADERRGLVRFLRRLDVLDREGAFEHFRCTSAFEYLVKEHHLAEGTAWRRVNAMRLVRRFPQLEAMLEDGLLNPTQLGILGHVLTPENVHDVLRAAAHLTKRKTEELAVSVVPRKVPTPGLRLLPATRPAAGALEAQAPPPELRAEARALDDEPPPPVVAHPGVTPAQASSALEPPPLAPSTPHVMVASASAAAGSQAVARIAPVAEREWQWRLRMDEARMAKLERLKGMLAHTIPDGDLDRIFDQMLEDSLAAQGKKRGFVEPSRPREAAPSKPPPPGERAPVPLSVRREVLKRDGFRCTWIHPDGSRCEATARLEMDHLEPARETGSSTAADLATRCTFHNRLRAIRRYGRRYVQERVAGERQARQAKRVPKA